MIYRPSQIGTFEFAVVAALRAEQLRRGCVPRVEGYHKFVVTAQQEEVIAGKVVRAVEGAVQDLPNAVELTQTPAAPSHEKHRDTDVVCPGTPTPLGLAEAEIAPTGPVTRGHVMSGGAEGRVSAGGATDPVPPGLAVQHVGKWSAASHPLSRSALERLCGKAFPNQARRAQLDLSQVIVATRYDEPIGLTAYKPGAAGVRVAHELWINADTPVRPRARGCLAPRTVGERSAQGELFETVHRRLASDPCAGSSRRTATRSRLKAQISFGSRRAFRSEPDRAKRGQ